MNGCTRGESLASVPRPSVRSARCRRWRFDAAFRFRPMTWELPGEYSLRTWTALNARVAHSMHWRDAGPAGACSPPAAFLDYSKLTEPAVELAVVPAVHVAVPVE